MIKQHIKRWLGIDKIEVQLQNNDKDILAIMDKQLRMAEDYPLKPVDLPKGEPQ